jgi:hypothetical protein
LSSTFDTGRVRIRLGVAGGCVTVVDVASERPQAAAVLRGKPADEAVRLVPLMFSLCGGAQGRAAMLALAAARGENAAPHLDRAVQTETLREHLWRLLLDLPPLLGLQSHRELFLTGMQAVAAGDRASLQAVLAQPFWNALREQLALVDQPPTAMHGLLPSFDAGVSLVEWPRLTADFAARPEWRGEPAETGAMARRGESSAGGAYATRWLARLQELEDWANGNDKLGAGGAASAAAVALGIGRALVVTARGLLMHEITLDGERVADYVIVAPTEWNFHPRGRLADWLRGIPAADVQALRALVGQAVAALDPCVRWELEICSI